MRHLPPLASVRVFEAAARHLNFTAAAHELGMTQAAVSYQVRLLEERLGIQLFRREKGRVSLTEGSRRLGTVITDAFDTMDHAFAQLRNDGEAVLSISASNTFAGHWLAPRLGRFQLEHPGLAVRLHASNDLIDFARDEIDISVRSSATRPVGLHAEKLFDVSFTPMATPAWLAEHALTSPEDVLGVPRLSPDDVWWRLWFEACGIVDAAVVRAGLRLDSQTIEGTAALADQGIAILAPAMWKRELTEGRLVAPFRVAATSGASFWLVCPEAQRNVAKIRNFRAWILEAVMLDR